jgi:hypothetical protein
MRFLLAVVEIEHNDNAEIKIPVQVNGKVRDIITVSLKMAQEDVVKRAWRATR